MITVSATVNQSTINVNVQSSLSVESQISDTALLIFAIANACSFLGAILSHTLFSPLADTKGRKIVLIITDFFNITGSVLIFLAKQYTGAYSISIFLLGRLFHGIALGTSSVWAIYIYENAHIKYRANLASSYMVVQILGILSQMTSGLEIFMGTEDLWHVSPLFAAVFSLPEIVMYKIIPETLNNTHPSHKIDEQH